MKENNSNVSLIEYFKEIFDFEKGARDMYDTFLLDLKNPEDLAQVKGIRDDEESHMQIVEKIIKIIEAD